MTLTKSMLCNCVMKSNSTTAVMQVQNGLAKALSQTEESSPTLSFSNIQYWNENHGNVVVSQSSKDICSLCHALSNQHCYNLSHDLLFCEETDEVKER